MEQSFPTCDTYVGILFLIGIWYMCLTLSGSIRCAILPYRFCSMIRLTSLFAPSIFALVKCLNCTMRYPRSLALLLLLQACWATASAQFLVEVIIDHRPVIRCDATGANFGDDVMGFSFSPYAIGCAFPVKPSIACSDVEPPSLTNHTGCISNFALVPRGNCTFSEKAYYVQKHYNGLIMYNDKGHLPIPMAGSKFAENVTIPVVMVNYACMESLVGHYSAENGYVVTLKASPGYYDLIKYLVPFVVIVGFCFVVLFISLVIRLWKERRRLAKKRLSRSNLKKIPTKRFTKGDREETCAICLDDFVEGDKLRVLPCRHAYHCKCIDPWLTKNRKVCPVCKRKVGPSSNDSSDSDSERASTSALPPSRENEPLIDNEQPMATSSSAEFPYPPTSMNSIPSAQNNSRRNILYRTRALLSLPRLFQREAAINRHDNLDRERAGTSNSTESISGRHRSREFLVPTENSQPTRVAQIRDRIVYNWCRMVDRSRGDSLPHSRLENEDASTTVTNEELETESSAETSNTLSAVENSLTTDDWSNRQFQDTSAGNDSQAR